MKRRISYAKRLTLYMILGTLIPVLLVSVVELYLIEHILKQELVNSTGEDASSISRGSGELMQSYTTILGTLSEDEDIQYALASGSRDLRQCYSKLYLLSSGHSNQMQLHIFDTSGKVSMTTASIPPHYLESWAAQWGVLRQALETDGVAVNSSDKSKEYNEDIAFSMSKAVRVNGEAVGFIVMDVYRSVLETLIHDRLHSSVKNIIVADQFDYVMYNMKNPKQEGWQGFPKQWLEENNANTSFFVTETDGDKILICHITEPDSGFQIIQYVSLDTVNNTILLTRQIVIIVCGCSLLLLPVVSQKTAKHIWNPIKMLNNAMREVHNNDFSTRVTDLRDDEVGDLGKTYNRMLDYIETLIENIESKQRSLRIAQVNALQSQVKPHFIYNTLNVIKWSAKMNDMEGVADLSLQLAKLMRMTISNEEEFVPVSTELETLKAYASIQQRRFDGRLSITFRIDEAILTQMIPRLILQPIVENAVEHGLRDTTGIGCVNIQAEMAGEYIVFYISDNGCGISPEMLEILHRRETDDHIGVRNVDSRARLYGDSNCGLNLESEVGNGTKATLILKVNADEGVQSC